MLCSKTVKNTNSRNVIKTKHVGLYFQLFGSYKEFLNVLYIFMMIVGMALEGAPYPCFVRKCKVVSSESISKQKKGHWR